MYSGKQKTGLCAWLIASALLGASACSDQPMLTNPSLADENADYSKAAQIGMAPGIAAVDTTVLQGVSLRMFWFDPTIAYAISGRNKVAGSPVWTVRDSTVLGVESTSGMYLTVTGKAGGKSYVLGKLGSRTDSVLVTVAALTVAKPPVPTPDPVVPVAPVQPVTPTGSPTYTQPIAPATVSTVYPSMTGMSRRVSQGQDLQAALDAAQPGDEVVLANGATFTGNYELPVKSGSNSWIVVRAETVPVGAGTRMTPSAATAVAKIVSPNSAPAIQTAPSASKWRLVGLDVAHTGAVYNYGVVVLGRGDERSLAELPSDIVLDRLYIHNGVDDGTSRCVAFNGRALAVIDSWLSECHAKGFDAQGVGGWGGPGPFLIENNRIEASGQAVMFGGSDPNIANLSPSDITIRHNYMYKPLSWGNGRWTVKATFELKHARRVLFEGNVLENHWADAQVGYAILFQAVTQDNLAPWSTVQDVLLQNNLIKNSTSGVNLLARFNSVVATPTSRIAVINNLFQDVGHDPITGGWGRVVQLLGELEDVTFLNNTTTLNGSASTAVMFDGAPEHRLVMANNVFPATEYGLFGSGTGVGASALSVFAPGAVMAGNVFTAQDSYAGRYPGNNFFPSSAQNIAFSSAMSGDFSLAANSEYYSSVLGKVGVNMSTLNAAISGTR